MAGYRELLPKAKDSVLAEKSKQQPSPMGGYREMMRKGGGEANRSILPKDRVSYVRFAGKKRGKGESLLQGSKKASVKSSESAHSSAESTAMPPGYKAPNLIIDPRYMVVSESESVQPKLQRAPADPAGTPSPAAMAGRPRHGRQRQPFRGHGKFSPHDIRYGGRRPQLAQQNPTNANVGDHGEPYEPPQERSKCDLRTWMIALAVILAFLLIAVAAVVLFFYFEMQKTKLDSKTTTATG